MKIIAIHKNLALGGAEKILLDYARVFKKDGQIFDIILLEDKIEFKNLDSLNIFPLLPSSNPSLSKILLLTLWPYYLLRFIKIIKEYDIIFSFERYPAYINFLLTKLCKKKSVIYVPVPIVPCLRESFSNQRLRKLHILLHQLILKKTDLVITISQGVKKEMIDIFGIKKNKIKVVEPFIDTIIIKKMALELLSKNEMKMIKGKIVLTCIARLNSQKNLGLLVNSFYEINKTIKNSLLLIIGEGNERKKLENLIRRLKLQNKVILTGAKTNPLKYLDHTDIFVLPSLYEGLGIVLLEALACRVPIVAVDSPFGIREIIDPNLSPTTIIKKPYLGKHGLLIPQNRNVKYHLVNAISRLIKNKVLQKKLTNNSRMILSKFSVEKKYHLFNTALKKIS